MLERAVQENLLIWQEEAKKRNLKINTNKTKVMRIGNDKKQMYIERNKEQIEQVNSLSIWEYGLIRRETWKQK